jgi:hypothetical protein
LGDATVKPLQWIFIAGYSLIILLFIGCAFLLISFAAFELWHAFDWRASYQTRERFNSVLESIGLLTIAVASLELGQTILEEEVRREAHVSAPTRVRRFLSRFMIVVVVSLSIESLVTVFQLAHDDPSRLSQAAAISIAAAALLAAWGVFIRLNRSAEELEPEGLEKAKSEDVKVE